MTVNSVYNSAINPLMLGDLTGVLSPDVLSRLSRSPRRRKFSSGDADLDEIFESTGKRHNISPNLLKAIAKVESNFNANATSKSGAMGIMQLMPGTVKYLGISNPYDCEQNIMGGAKYLKEQLIRFHGNIELALAAYNAGWAAVVNHGGVPPFKKTRSYISRVLSYLGEKNANSLTYDGFDMTGTRNISSRAVSSAEVKNTPGKTPFNYNEALAQMLFIKLMEGQMSANRTKRTESATI